MFSLGVRRTVEAAGCRYCDVQLPASRDANLDLAALGRVLDCNPDFALIRSPRSRLARVAACVAQKGVRYATVACDVISGGMCVGNIRYGVADALEDFVGDCVRMGVRSVLQFDYGPGSYIDAQERLESVGVTVERLSLSRGARYEDLDDLVRDAADIMTRRMRKGPLPELLLLTDDFISSGVISTLYRAGLRIPGDVKVVAYANRRSGFSFTHTMACLELDPYQEGVNCSRIALRFLKTGVFTPYLISPVYRRGVSFPIM